VIDRRNGKTKMKKPYSDLNEPFKVKAGLVGIKPTPAWGFQKLAHTFEKK